jgi:hypothetical protein
MAAKISEGPVFGIQAKIGLAHFLVGPVALETIVRQDRPDIAVEGDGVAGPRPPGGGS